ncbi:MAG: TIGR00730 family Rossman fold protein [Bacteroidota bacterium]
MRLCVYCASSTPPSPLYVHATQHVGTLIGQRGHTLVYGGGDVGLMGVVARAAHEAGGTVFGVIPAALRDIEGVAYEVADDLVVTQTMQERKALMYNLADAFLVLPGGFGTLEEFMEVLTLRNLGYHQKPIVVLNTDGVYDPLLAFFEGLQEQGMVRPHARAGFHVAATPEAAVAHAETRA